MTKKIKNKSYIENSQELDLQIFREKLEESLAEIEDPRVQDNQTYTLSTLMGIILCAVISGANSILAISEYAASKQEWLQLWLDLPDREPSYSAFWWLLVGRIRYKQKSYFADGLTHWIPPILRR